jgi:hypothetical protein
MRVHSILCRAMGVAEALQKANLLDCSRFVMQNVQTF